MPRVWVLANEECSEQAPPGPRLINKLQTLFNKRGYNLAIRNFRGGGPNWCLANDSGRQRTPTNSSTVLLPARSDCLSRVPGGQGVDLSTFNQPLARGVVHLADFLETEYFRWLDRAAKQEASPWRRPSSASLLPLRFCGTARPEVSVCHRPHQLQVSLDSFLPLGRDFDYCPRARNTEETFSLLDELVVF